MMSNIFTLNKIDFKPLTWSIDFSKVRCFSIFVTAFYAYTDGMGLAPLEKTQRKVSSDWLLCLPSCMQ